MTKIKIKLSIEGKPQSSVMGQILYLDVSIPCYVNNAVVLVFNQTSDIAQITFTETH